MKPLVHDVGMHDGADTDFYLQWLCSFHICSWPIALAKAGTRQRAASAASADMDADTDSIAAGAAGFALELRFSPATSGATRPIAATKATTTSPCTGVPPAPGAGT